MPLLTRRAGVFYGSLHREGRRRDLREGWAIPGSFNHRTLPELGGNFRLCAVDQKRSFFPRVGPFLDVLPFKGPFPLTGALTGRLPYRKAPYGEASYGKAPYGEASYGRHRKAYGKAGPSREAPYEEGRLVGRQTPLWWGDPAGGRTRMMGRPSGGETLMGTLNPELKPRL